MKTTEPSGRNPATYTRPRAGACRTAFALLACLLTGMAQAAPRLLVTIDVESVDGASLPTQIDAICRDHSPCGLMEIARQLEAHSLRGTFFLNVYEAHRWGEPAMRQLAERLIQRGHDVALHTHPHWQYDAQRPYMYQYSAADQVRIVREGMTMLQAWTGMPVVAHRAGAYSADPHTLEALRANGIGLDSSWFRDYPHSKLGSLGLPDNAPGMALGVLEIPVTVYERVEIPRGLGFLPGVRSTRKLDVNWLRDTDESARAVEAAIATNPPYLVYFLHSFSLMSPDGSATPGADTNAQANFHIMLERAAALGLVGETFRGLHDSGAQSSSTVIRVPEVTLEVPVANYTAHLVRKRPLLFVLLASPALLAAWLGWRAWRRPRGARAPAA